VPFPKGCKLSKACALKFSLLSPPHHFHLTCTNCPLFLVVQVDFILNSYLWVHPNPILEFQHTLLPPKCYELRACPNSFLFPLFHYGTHCHDFSFRLATKAKAWKGAGHECNPGATIALLRMWGNEPTHFQVDSHFASWNSHGIPNFQKGI
jgi:hypothetical protein